MAKDGHKFWIVCPDCRGMGKNSVFEGPPEGGGQVVEVDCVRCSGVKFIFGGWIADELKNMPNNLPGGID